MLSRVAAASTRATAPFAPGVRAALPRAAVAFQSSSVEGGARTEPHAADFPPDAYRRSPFDRSIVLYERSVKEMFQNVQHLASEGNRPKLDALHRLLRRAETSRDVDFALSALTLCRTRFVEFNEDTASLFVNACIRGNRLDTAADVLRRSTTFRLWPSRSAFHRLMVAAAQAGEVDLVEEMLKVLQSNAYTQPNSQTYYIASRALVSAGRVEEALSIWKDGAKAGVANVGSSGVNAVGVLCLGIVGADVTPSRELVQPVLDAAGGVSRPAVVKLVDQVKVAVAAAEAAAAAEAEAAAEETPAEEEEEEVAASE